LEWLIKRIGYFVFLGYKVGLEVRLKIEGAANLLREKLRAQSSVKIRLMYYLVKWVLKIIFLSGKVISKVKKSWIIVSIKNF